MKPNPAKMLRKIYKTEHSWQKVANKLHLSKSKGVIYAVAKGQRPATPSICAALGVPYIRHELVEVCPKCNRAHRAKRCPVPPTFEDRVKLYATWLTKNMTRIVQIIDWAEGHPQ